ncbi:hypothetical protein Cde04nite_34180 [Cellulomonas denverensis]|nr:hypothetical protein Cde04nite_34180 [Cellulomonas denverensis]
MAGRRCPGRDEVDGRTRACPVILTRGERYCGRHARSYERRRGSRQARGYDATHDRARAGWQARMDSGERVYCATCGVLLNGSPWDLGHTDDRRSYRGPQCLPCNRSDGGRRGRATQS